MKRQLISSGGKYEATFGYSRAVRVGNFVFISGTGPAGEDGNVVGVGDSYVQTKQCLKLIEVALKQAGASVKDIVRTRIYITDMQQWPGVERAHGEIFKEIRPASLMVEVKSLIYPESLIEIEADAVIVE